MPEGTLIHDVERDGPVPVTAHRNEARHRRYATHIPEEVVEYFHAHNRQIRWGSSNEVMQATDSALGYLPVRLADLDEDGQTLLSSHWVGNAAGTIEIGDMILQWRTFEDKEMQLEDEAAIRASLEDPGRFIQALQDSDLPEGVTVHEGKSHDHSVADDMARIVPDEVLEMAEEMVKKRKASPAGEEKSEAQKSVEAIANAEARKTRGKRS